MVNILPPKYIHIHTHTNARAHEFNIIFMFLFNIMNILSIHEKFTGERNKMVAHQLQMLTSYAALGNVWPKQCYDAISCDPNALN